MVESDERTITTPLRAYIAGLAMGGGESYKYICESLTALADEIDLEQDNIISEILEDMQ